MKKLFLTFAAALISASFSFPVFAAGGGDVVLRQGIGHFQDPLGPLTRLQCNGAFRPIKKCVQAVIQ